MTLLVVLLAALAAYAGLCALLYGQQRALMYFPHATRVAAATSDLMLERGDVTLRGWVVNPGRARAILYFGGNAESIEHNRAAFAHWFPDSTVYLLAYRGYGASGGSPTQAALCADALALYDRVRRERPGAPIAVLGRSLGGGVAAHLAAHRPVARVALVTPFDSMAAVARAHYPWLPVHALLKDDYPAAAQLGGYRGPVLVIRAGRDRVIPNARTQALIDALPQPPQVLELHDAGHDDVQEFPAYAQALTAFFQP